MQKIENTKENQEQKDPTDFLSFIFYKDITNSDYIPIMKYQYEINHLDLFFSDKTIPIDQKISAVDKLTILLSKNPALINHINSYNKDDILFKIGINLYLIEDNSPEADDKILNYLKLIRRNVSITIKILQIVYQNLSNYYHNKSECKLNSKLLLKHLELLNIFYQERQANYIDNQIKDTRNYIYFNGIGSELKVNFNPKRRKIDIRYSNFEYGMGIMFWIKIEKEVFKDFNVILNEKEANLINIELSEDKHLKLSLTKDCNIKISSLINRTSFLNIKKHFNFSQWNNFYIVIKGKQAKEKEKDNFIIYINKHQIFKGSIGNIHKEPLLNMTLMENIVCKITSILIFNFFFDISPTFFLQFPLGIFKDKHLFQIIQSNHHDYLKFSNSPYKNTVNIINKAVFNFNFLSGKNEENIIIFSSFLYDDKSKIIDDACGNFIGYLKESSVNIYTSNGKNTKVLGGIQNILPIAELMLLSKKKNITHQITKDLLNENTFNSFLTLLKTIIIDNPQNLQEANETNFFTSLGLFIEKFPKEIFSLRNFKELGEIGSFVFKNESIKDPKRNFNQTILLNEKIISKFSSQIEKRLWETVYTFTEMDFSQIGSVLSIPKICLLLRYFDNNRYRQFCCKEHAEIFLSDNDKPLDDIDMRIMQPEMNKRIENLCLAIKKIFIKNPQPSNCDLFKLLSLDLSPCLQKSITLIFISFFNDESVSYKEKSSCLSYFIENKCLDIALYALSVSLLDVRSIIIELIGIFLNDYEELVDNKIKDLKIKYPHYRNSYTEGVKLQLHMNKEDLDKKMEEISKENMLLFISENIFPSDLLLEVNENNDEVIIPKTAKKGTVLDKKFAFNCNEERKNRSRTYIVKRTKKIPLLSVMNDKKYNVQVEIMWNSLKKMLINKKELIKSDMNNKSNKKKENKKTSEIPSNTFNLYIINFFIKFCQQMHSKYIILFIMQLNGIAQITNNEYLFRDNKLYKWVIQTFYFYDENCKFYLIEKNPNPTTISEIRTNLEPLLESFLNFFPGKEFEKIYLKRIRYLLTFTLYLKNHLLNQPDNMDENKKKEKINYILDTTRKILIKSLQNDHCTNSKVKIIFEFMFILNKSDLYTERTITNYNIITKTFDRPLLSNILTEGLSLNEEKSDDCNSINNDRNSEKEYPLISKPSLEITLSSKWRDFSLFDLIIGKYSNYWDISSICTLFSIKIPDKLSLENIAPKLVSEVGLNKKKKNILLNTLREFLFKFPMNSNINIAQNLQEIIKDPISLINLIEILLSIAIEFTNSDFERRYWEKEYQKFLAFCLLCSINIIPSEKDYDIIQKDLEIVIGYGFIFLQNKNEKLVKELIENFVEPIFSIEKKTNIFSSSKLNLSKSAVFNSFKYTSSSNDETNSNTLNINENIKLTAKVDIIKFEFFRIKYIDYYSKKLIKIQTKYFFYQKPNTFKIDNITNRVLKEKNRIENSIKDIIPLFENQIKLYSNGSFLEEKLRKRIYKKAKASMFAWNGLWSDKVLFYDNPHLLKVRNKNHYTSEMIRPLLVPILDVNYYLPNFTKFKSQLFNVNKSYNYIINLNIDDILDIEEQEENFSLQENFSLFHLGFNYLESIYKLSYTSLWKYYNKDFIQKLSKKRLLYSEEEMRELIKEKQGGKQSKKSKNRKSTIINCCMVRQTHHIKGLITLEDKKIKFYAFENKIKKLGIIGDSQDESYPINHMQEELEVINEDPNYDNDRKMCFGSYFVNNKKDKDKCCFKLPYSDIQYVFYRNYFYQNNSIEVFTYTHKSYFFAFETINDCDQFKKELNTIIQYKRNIKIGKDEHIGIIQYNKFSKKNTYSQKIYTISIKEEEWVNFQISTLEYLMWLNLFGNRSFNDLTQYPVFPWVFTDFNCDKNPSIRPFFEPMGMLDISESSKQRRLQFEDIYQTMKSDYNAQKDDKGNNALFDINPLELNQIPYYYGSHYSNPTYVSHFLMRIFPYSTIAIEIQGSRFDDPERLFQSIEKSFNSCSSQKTDVRELSPEFFYLPEMFINVNNLNLVEVERQKQYGNLDNVEMPKWCNKDPFAFVELMRSCLEKEEIAVNQGEINGIDEKENLISMWINLIFGVYQRGKNAEKKKNLYMASTYGLNIAQIETREDRDALMRLVEMGMTPSQVLSDKAKDKNGFMSPLVTKEGALLCNSEKLTKDDSKIKCELSLTNKNLKIVEIKLIDVERILLVYNNSKYFVAKITSKENENLFFYDGKIQELSSDSFDYIVNYNMSGRKTPFVIYANKQKVIQGGFWDGRFEVISLETTSKVKHEHFAYYHYKGSPITVITINKDENFFFCGTICGQVYFYQLRDTNPLYIRTLYDNQSEITSIAVNDILNLVAVSSIDGYVYIYTIPLLEKVRSLVIKEDYPHWMFLSNSPLPALIVFNGKKFICFSINGIVIGEKVEIDKITTYILLKSHTFEDFVIYGTDNGKIKIRKFPNMELMTEKNIVKGAIIAIEISKEKKNLYVWGEGNGDNINIIRDQSVRDEKSCNNLNNVFSIY